MDNSDINKSLEDINKAKKDLFAKERMYNKSIKGLSSEEKKGVLNSHNDISLMFGNVTTFITNQTLQTQTH